MPRIVPVRYLKACSDRVTHSYCYKLNLEYLLGPRVWLFTSGSKEKNRNGPISARFVGAHSLPLLRLPTRILALAH
jgi:hypothetical protein